MKLEIYILRIKHYITRYGLLKLIKSVFERIYRKIFKDEYYVYFINTADISYSKNNLETDVSIFRYRTIESIPHSILDGLCKEKGGNKLVGHYLKKNFAKNADLWIAKFKGEFSGLRWTAIRGYRGFYFFPTTNRDAIFFDGEIFPKYRGKGISPEMLKKIFIKLKKEGIERIYGDVKIWNKTNIRSLPKTGLKRIGRVRKFKIKAKEYLIWSSEKIS